MCNVSFYNVNLLHEQCPHCTIRPWLSITSDLWVNELSLSVLAQEGLTKKNRHHPGDITRKFTKFDHPSSKGYVWIDLHG